MHSTSASIYQWMYTYTHLNARIISTQIEQSLNIQSSQFNYRYISNFGQDLNPSKWNEENKGTTKFCDHKNMSLRLIDYDTTAHIFSDTNSLIVRSNNMQWLPQRQQCYTILTKHCTSNELWRWPFKTDSTSALICLDIHSCTYMYFPLLMARVSDLRILDIIHCIMGMSI